MSNKFKLDITKVFFIDEEHETIFDNIACGIYNNSGVCPLDILLW